MRVSKGASLSGQVLTLFVPTMVPTPSMVPRHGIMFHMVTTTCRSGTVVIEPQVLLPSHGDSETSWRRMTFARVFTLY